MRVAADPRFERDGDDLLHVRRLAFTQVALGSRLDIETLEGPEELIVPAGTQPGHVFRLKGRGVPTLRGRGRGDLLVRVDVDVPGRLTAEEDELLRERGDARRRGRGPARKGRLLPTPVCVPVANRMDRTGPYLGPADVPARAHVYVERLDDVITIEGDDGHHLARARRLRAGETVTAADGYGRWRRYTVAGIAAGTVRCATADFAHEAASSRHSRSRSADEGSAPELAVQKLTELGADEIVLVQSTRSIVR